jgi:transcriptional regulator with XRE-family HTH domain
MSESENILFGLISDEVSNWKTKAEYRKANKSWLDKSAIIALKILNYLKMNGISQKQLAEMVNVSPQQINKIVKGSENLTLETISKIEDALGIKLIVIENFEQTMIYELPNKVDLERNKYIFKIIDKTQNIDSSFSLNYSQDNLSA